MEPDLYEYRAVKRMLDASPGFSTGIQALLEYCKERRPHPVWDQMAELDYGADVAAVQAWLAERLPIPEDLHVLWFAPWDLVVGFSLEAAPAWSRDPESWEWWHECEIRLGDYESPLLDATSELASGVDEKAGEDDSVYHLVEWVLAIGYICLAVIEIVQSIPAADLLGVREELWLVSGHPDAEYGLIIGRVTPAGFERCDPQ